ncbi:rhomboid-like protein [Actinomadura logoneensis]|uniref:rhomboid-like protein n=1 Tax=Actinomadura logoneensis TaxID=2293572 RepID=UPI0011C18C7F|nr:rhomboid-like protein [Actinomadura logoneensis]
MLRTRAATWAYVAALAVAEAVVWSLSPEHKARVVGWVSTNVANLSHHPVGSLAASALVPDSYPVVWVGLAVVAVLPVNALLGNRRTVLLFVLLHLLGTLVSEGVVAWRLAHAALPEAARHQLDTGPSFVLVPGLVLVVLFGTWWWRPIAAVGMWGLWPYLFVGLGRLEVAAVGHVTVMVLAVPLFLLLRRGHVPATGRPVPEGVVPEGAVPEGVVPADASATEPLTP